MIGARILFKATPRVHLKGVIIADEYLGKAINIKTCPPGCFLIAYEYHGKRLTAKINKKTVLEYLT